MTSLFCTTLIFAGAGGPRSSFVFVPQPRSSRLLPFSFLSHPLSRLSWRLRKIYDLFFPPGILFSGHGSSLSQICPLSGYTGAWYRFAAFSLSRRSSELFRLKRDLESRLGSSSRYLRSSWLKCIAKMLLREETCTPSLRKVGSLSKGGTRLFPEPTSSQISSLEPDGDPS